MRANISSIEKASHTLIVIADLIYCLLMQADPFLLSPASMSSLQRCKARQNSTSKCKGEVRSRDQEPKLLFAYQGSTLVIEQSKVIG